MIRKLLWNHVKTQIIFKTKILNFKNKNNNKSIIAHINIRVTHHSDSLLFKQGAKRKSCFTDISRN